MELQQVGDKTNNIGNTKAPTPWLGHICQKSKGCTKTAPQFLMDAQEVLSVDRQRLVE